MSLFSLSDSQGLRPARPSRACCWLFCTCLLETLRQDQTSRSQYPRTKWLLPLSPPSPPLSPTLQLHSQMGQHISRFTVYLTLVVKTDLASKILYVWIAVIHFSYRALKLDSSVPQVPHLKMEKGTVADRIMVPREGSILMSELWIYITQ